MHGQTRGSPLGPPGHPAIIRENCVWLIKLNGVSVVPQQRCVLKTNLGRLVGEYFTPIVQQGTRSHVRSPRTRVLLLLRTLFIKKYSHVRPSTGTRQLIRPDHPAVRGGVLPGLPWVGYSVL